MIKKTENKCIAPVENSMAVLGKLKIKLPCDPAIPFLSIYTKELHARSQRDIFTPMFIVASSQ